jgi:actin-like protein 6B
VSAAEGLGLGELLCAPSSLDEGAAALPPALRAARAALPAGAPSLASLVVSSAMGCDPEVRRALMASIVLTGGLSATPGLPERLVRELEGAAPPGTEARVAAAAPEERGFGPWLGGSILASLGTHSDLYFTKAE